LFTLASVVRGQVADTGQSTQIRIVYFLRARARAMAERLPGLLGS